MTPAARTLEQLVWELRRAFRELAAAADAELAPLGITASDRALLEMLAREEEPLRASELARRRGVSRQHVHQSLRRLPDPRWVEQLEDSEDRRNVRLRLSAKGRAMWKRVRALDEAFFQRLAARLPRDEVAAAAQLLARVRSEVSHG